MATCSRFLATYNVLSPQHHHHLSTTITSTPPSPPPSPGRVGVVADGRLVRRSSGRSARMSAHHPCGLSRCPLAQVNRAEVAVLNSMQIAANYAAGSLNETVTSQIRSRSPWPRAAVRSPTRAPSLAHRQAFAHHPKDCDKLLSHCAEFAAFGCGAWKRCCPLCSPSGCLNSLSTARLRQRAVARSGV